MTAEHFLKKIPLCEAKFTGGENSSKTGAVPERAEIEEKYKWDLEKIYPSLDEWEKAFSEVSMQVGEVAKFAGNVGKSSASLLSFLKQEESVSKELGRLYVYANMKSHEDLRASAYQEGG